MMTTIKAAPPNMLVLIGDRTGDIPETMAGRLVAATSTRVAVGTQYAYDGETSITLSDESVDAMDGTLAFDGVLETPSRKMTICTVLNEVLLEMNVPTDLTRVQIWTNHPSEPDTIAVVARAVQ